MKESMFGSPEHIAALRKGIAISQSGFAGVNKQGRIVDRREDPTATKIQQNSLFNVPKPKKV